MDALRLELEGAEQEQSRIGSQEQERETTQVHDRAVMAQARSSDSVRPKNDEEREMSLTHAGA
jgi:hypothetical protein